MKMIEKCFFIHIVKVSGVQNNTECTDYHHSSDMFFCVLKPEYKLAEAKIYSSKQTTLQSYNFSSPLLITDNSFNNYL